VLQATLDAARLTQQHSREEEKREGSGWLTQARMTVVRLVAGSHASAAWSGSVRARAVGLRGVCGSGSG
jgi:hypothetical protein